MCTSTQGWLCYVVLIEAAVFSIEIILDELEVLRLTVASTLMDFQVKPLYVACLYYV